MSSPEKKKKEPTPTPTLQSTPKPSLPDDLLLSCFARVSRLYDPTLSLVSKRFRSLLASPELYKARSLLGNTENCLYVCLGFYPCSRWYALCRKPDQTLTIDDTSEEKKSRGYVLALTRSPYARFSGLVAVGSNIYNIEERSFRVSTLDCRYHTWRQAPSLRMKLSSLSVSVVDQKIYVAGRIYKDGDSLKKSFEVFDTKTQIWDPEPIPRSACIDGKFYVNAHTEVVAYNSKEGRWDLDDGVLNDYMHSGSYCEIENVLYSASHGELRWYDITLRKWKYVIGLKGLPEFTPDICVRLADYGGNMAVLWERDLLDSRPGGGYEKKIWCAEIALERCLWREIQGKVEWCDHVLTVPKLYGLVNFLAVTVW